MDAVLGLSVGTMSPLRILERDPHQDQKPVDGVADLIQ